MTTLTVALLFGGRSSEHEISCSTASGVLSAIDRSKYNVIAIGITKSGAVTLQPDDAAMFAMNPDAMPVVPDNGTRVHWPESSTTRELTVTDASGVTRSLGDVDVVFPILHGPFGEDGTVQGLLELVGLPYVGNGVLASALGMDKHFAKTALEGAGVAVAPWVTVSPYGWQQERDRITADIRELGLPLFVKPARAGSSVGVSKVTSLDELDAALTVAFAEDSRALVEAAISGREVECGVLSGRGGEPPRVSVAGEIIMHGRDFYDFEAKYIDPDAAELVCPASLEPDELAQMQRIAARAFDAIGGSGLARVDFFFTGTEFIVNELNTMPGFTPISMYPKCWQASGLSYTELIDELIQLGLEAVR
ncbi:D-alanine-D-alanine ligase [Microbacteriaceae bacterium SG_E_30_P1]|uniref:D-alanine--D-alanine ligase n=1 Tax=Antiquaquibacter oligotrophicus TaxID=2880260 RepID=A0ABT6KNA1_9MICO|nr:D-alanine--D-alanine ligase family protein [Antiquaquibacter oligotrophicus]MDH6181483.1 D-alanine-D-alanine ligase [Antiquaquibacter oligotrophicus]UDF12827.1 D-alanine--D-alanine ligase [Antiquaquibacter oligotrophicus]